MATEGGSAEKTLIAAGFMPLEHSLMPIAKGGSARSFVRFKDAKLGDCVACFYTSEREENRLYARISEFLSSCGVRVPKVYFHDEGDGLMIMQSAGFKDLGAFKRADANFAELYFDALSNLAALHLHASKKFADCPVETMPHFDAELYAWEQGYFLENCLIGRFGLHVPEISADFDRISKALLAQRCVLLHRDFQSQNVMVLEEKGRLKTYFIDFQGMRLGVPWYDVASLIYDPYVEIPRAFKTLFFDYYYAATRPAYGLDKPAALEIFRLCAAERLMQALGAYGFLSQKKGKKEYEKYFLPALKNLAEVSKEAGLEAVYAAAQACLKKG